MTTVLILSEDWIWFGKSFVWSLKDWIWSLKSWICLTDRILNVKLYFIDYCDDCLNNAILFNSWIRFAKYWIRNIKDYISIEKPAWIISHRMTIAITRVWYQIANQSTLHFFNEIRSVQWHTNHLKIIENTDYSNLQTITDLNVKVNNLNGVTYVFFFHL